MTRLIFESRNFHNTNQNRLIFFFNIKDIGKKLHSIQKKPSDFQNEPFITKIAVM